MTGYFEKGRWVEIDPYLKPPCQTQLQQAISTELAKYINNEIYFNNLTIHEYTINSYSKKYDHDIEIRLFGWIHSIRDVTNQ